MVRNKGKLLGILGVLYTILNVNNCINLKYNKKKHCETFWKFTNSAFVLIYGASDNGVITDTPIPFNCYRSRYRKNDS